MLQDDSARSVLNDGDYVVMPALPDRQVLPPPQRARLRKVRDITISSGPLTWLRTMSQRPYGGYYYFSLRDDSSPPWMTSTKPLETFTIYAVTK